MLLKGEALRSCGRGDWVFLAVLRSFIVGIPVIRVGLISLPLLGIDMEICRVETRKLVKLVKLECLTPELL